MMLAALVSTMLAAAAPTAPTAPVPPPLPANATVQQYFDAAGAAEERGDLAAALELYDAIERRLAVKGSAASLAIMRGRRGIVLFELHRVAEAATALRYAQANLPNGPNLRGDRYLVALTLGKLEERALNYDAAQGWYESAERDVEPTERAVVWSALARVRMFEDTAAALALVDRALAAAQADPANKSAALAGFHTLRGRVLLNARNYPAAQAELKQAVADLGGLTPQLDLNDVAARSDFAIAAMLNGDKEAARKYMAFTGAGTQRDVLSPASEGDAPPCGGPADLKPEDVAIVEFAIGEDGSVTAITPIYASRGGPVALEFARTVSGWSWTRDEAARIKPFFRAFVRVELRCSATADRPGIVGLFGPAAREWLTARGISPYEPAQPSAVLALPPAEEELRRREAAAGVASPALLPPLLAMAANPVVDDERRRALAARAIRIAEAAGAPSQVLAYLILFDVDLARFSASRNAVLKTVPARLEAAVARPDIAGDPQARAGLRLQHADILIGVKDRAAALPLLQQIVDDQAVDAHDPLKVGAWLRLASIHAWQKDLAAAREAYQRTGLVAQECALVDARPALVNDNASSSRFPQEAMRWGFEGWAETEFDIAADGRTAGVRTVVAYPPFVFSPAAAGVMAGARFTQTYRPEGGLGCGGQRQRIRFGLPFK